jgi:hypothetical protein
LQLERLLERVGRDHQGKFSVRMCVVNPLVDTSHDVVEDLLVLRAERGVAPLVGQTLRYVLQTLEPELLCVGKLRVSDRLVEKLVEVKVVTGKKGDRVCLEHHRLIRYFAARVHIEDEGTGQVLKFILVPVEGTYAELESGETLDERP